MSEPSTINVLVTGFGPYPKPGGGSYERNTSHEITRLLPNTLEPHTKLNPTSTRIHLINPTANEGCHVRAEYAYIRAYTSAVHTSHASDVSLILHIGQADGWDFVSVERRAYKQGSGKDEDGKGREFYVIPDQEGKTAAEAGPCPWGDDVPMCLSTGVDVDTVVEGARKTLGPEPRWSVGAHEDPGTYCCGFMMYESLACKRTRKTPAEVMFCHVPSELDAVSLEAGRDAIAAIIGSAVRGLLERGTRDRADGLPPQTNGSLPHQKKTVTVHWHHEEPIYTYQN